MTASAAANFLDVVSSQNLYALYEFPTTPDIYSLEVSSPTGNFSTLAGYPANYVTDLAHYPETNLVPTNG